MKKIIYFVITLCLIFAVVLGFCIYQQNSHEWLFAFLLFVSLLTLCILESVSVRKLRTFAYKDGPTGVLNRSAYEENVIKLNKTIRKNKNIKLGVIMFDVNGLKKINDSLGHRAGDLCISESAKLLKDVYTGAELYRFGGDEFVAIIKGSRTDKIKTYADMFVKKLNDINAACNVLPFKLSIAFGSAVYDKTSDNCFLDVFNRADQLMYCNKHSQKSQK